LKGGKNEGFENSLDSDRCAGCPDCCTIYRILVDTLTSHLAEELVYMKVIDITGLGHINEDDWDALVLIHTTERSKPPADVNAYLGRVHDLSKVIVVTTSGSGEWKSEDYDVDVMTSASKTEELPGMVKHIVARLQQIMHAVSAE
jgi:hypothetical protein